MKREAQRNFHINTDYLCDLGFPLLVPLFIAIENTSDIINYDWHILHQRALLICNINTES